MDRQDVKKADAAEQPDVVAAFDAQDEFRARWIDRAKAAEAEVERLRGVCQWWSDNRDSWVKAARAAEARLQAVEALADELDEFAKMGWRGGVRLAARNLRERLAALADAAPDPCPDWMGVDQYDPCQCLLTKGHEPPCVCSHTAAKDPRTAASSVDDKAGE